MTRTDKQVHDEMTEASFDHTIQFSELDSMLALTMKDPTSSPSPVRRGASMKSIVWSASSVAWSIRVAMTNISSSAELINSNSRKMHIASSTRAHHQQYSSPSDVGCNITASNTRSGDVLNSPVSGVTLVIVSSTFPVAVVAATTSMAAFLAPTITTTATTTRRRTTSTTATATLITTVVRVFGGRPYLA